MGLLEFLEQPAVKIGIKLLIVVLLLVIVYNQYYKKERMHVISYSAGADQRSTQQEFSGTNQRPYETGYNSSVLDAFPFPDQSEDALLLAQANEHFSGRREHASNIPPSQASEEILAANLYREHFAPDDIVKAEIATARTYSA
jgi:hypothetical protein